MIYAPRGHVGTTPPDLQFVAGGGGLSGPLSQMLRPVSPPVGGSQATLQAVSAGGRLSNSGLRQVEALPWHERGLTPPEGAYPDASVIAPHCVICCPSQSAAVPAKKRALRSLPDASALVAVGQAT